MQICGVGLWTAGMFRRALVRRQLNQIPGDETSSDSKVSEDLHEQPCRVSAGPRSLFESLLACLDARIQPCHITNFVSHPAVQVDQKGNRSTLLARKTLKKSLHQRANRVDRAIGVEVLG